jgi:hypothetical protein
MIAIMENEINNNTCQYPETLEELVDMMETHPDRYKHLEIFLSREAVSDFPDFGEEYLVVSREGFALYRLDSVDYQDGRVLLSLTEQSTNQPVKFSVDINNLQPSCFFVRWKNIWDLVLDDCLRSDIPNEDLLELID